MWDAEFWRQWITGWQILSVCTYICIGVYKKMFGHMKLKVKL